MTNTEIYNSSKESLAMTATEKFDFIVSNPPYIPQGKGKPSPIFEKAIARHELKGTIRDLLKTIKAYLKEQGSSVVIFPFARKSEVESICQEIFLKIKSMVFTDYANVVFHTDPQRVNAKTKIVFEICHA
jgi:tRNA1(Val) A37 N6-methylase TrmN6